MIVPNIFQLSSGETSLFDIFLSILRDFELSGSQFSNAADIRGIVVVDEMDLHLHAVHQHEVLPSRLRIKGVSGKRRCKWLPMTTSG